MKRFSSILLLLLLALGGTTINAHGKECSNKEQSSILRGPEYLGILTYVDIDLGTAVNGKITITIPVPSEGIDTNLNPIGPGRPYLTNDLGSTVDLVLFARNLSIFIDGDPGDIPIEIPVTKWVSSLGVYSSQRTDICSIQCYYTVVGHIK